MLTKIEIDEYVLNGGSYCPYCKSPDIAGENINFDGGTMSQTISCSLCNKRWEDIYTLGSLEEYDDIEPLDGDEVDKRTKEFWLNLQEANGNLCKDELEELRAHPERIHILYEVVTLREVVKVVEEELKGLEVFNSAVNKHLKGGDESGS